MNNQDKKIVGLGIVAGLAFFGNKLLNKRRENPSLKEYNAENKVSAALKKAIKNVLSYHERYKKSYFWTGTGGASSRRNKEKEFASNNPAFKIINGDEIIEVFPELSISANNFYYSLNITKNGKKSNITALKKFLKPKMLGGRRVNPTKKASLKLPYTKFLLIGGDKAPKGGTWILFDENGNESSRSKNGFKVAKKIGQGAEIPNKAERIKLAREIKRKQKEKLKKKFGNKKRVN